MLLLEQSQHCDVERTQTAKVHLGHCGLNRGLIERQLEHFKNDQEETAAFLKMDGTPSKFGQNGGVLTGKNKNVGRVKLACGALGGLSISEISEASQGLKLEA